MIPTNADKDKREGTNNNTDIAFKNFPSSRNKKFLGLRLIMEKI